MNNLITVKHSGNVGDLIYSLPVLKHLSNLKNDTVFIYLNPVDGRMSHTLAKVVAPLLEHQDYISGTAIYEGQPLDHDLDDFRNFPHENLGEMHCKIFGFDFSILNEKSIQIKPELNYNLSTYDIIINRTERYTNDKFPWISILNEQHANQSKAFVGLPHEFELFQKQFNITNLHYVPTHDYLQVAWLINNSKLFIGNCSSPYAIAEGLKHPTIQESAPWCLTCLYKRPTACYFIHDFIQIV
jgi:hypothetical protein